jgi:hypothetical protein
MEKTHHTPRDEAGRNAPLARRPYTAPKLVEYGSVAKLTQGNGTVRSGDGGAMMRL